MKISKIITTKSIDKREFVSVQTAEFMEDIVKGSLIHRFEDKDLIKADYYDYVTVDCIACDNLEKHLLIVDMGRVLLLANMVKGYRNILYCRRTGLMHTKKTLREALGYQLSHFNKFIAKLTAMSVLDTVEVTKKRRKYTIFIFNPSVARHSKFLHKETIVRFVDLSKESISDVLSKRSLSKM